MPIYKVNVQLSTGSRSSVTDSADQLAYAELPESERYVVQEAVDKQPVEHFNEDKMMSSESATDFIEREIREQRLREKELAAVHNLVQSAVGTVTPRTSSTDAAPAVEQKRRSADVTDHHVVVTASAAPKSFREVQVLSDPPSLHRNKDDKSDMNNNADAGRVDLSDNPRVREYHGFPGDDEELWPEGQQFAHPGESLIVKELLEQQRREDELRQHWKSMGFDLNEDHNADDDDIFNDRQDPDDRKTETKMAVTMTSAAAPLEASHFPAADHDQPRHQQDKTSPEKAPLVVEVPQPKLSITEPLVSVSAASRPDTVTASERVSVTSTVTGRTSTTELSPETPKYVKKMLLPLESAADTEDTASKVYLQPQAERAMEREMRAAREREIELREARGIPATTHEEARRSVSIEIEVIKPTIRVDATDGAKLDGRPTSSGGELAPDYRDFTKRFAESRLKVELQRERQRELDLRQSGVIHTISEERVGEPVKFVEVFASDEERAAVKLEASRRFRRSADPDMAPSPQQRPGDAASAHAASLPPVPATAPVKATSTPEKDQSPFHGYRRELPQVLRTYNYPYTTESRNIVTADTLMSSTRVSQGNRIELEVEEFQKRENELRELREMLLRERAAKETGEDHVTSYHHDDRRHDNLDKHDNHQDHRRQDSDEDLPLPDRQEVGARTSLPADVTSSSGRRRLAMIAEWEKMSSS